MIDLTNDLTALVTRATEALARGETVKIGSVHVRQVGQAAVALRDERAFAAWEGPDAPASVLREAIFAAMGDGS